MSRRLLSTCLPHLRRAALNDSGAGLTDGQLLGEFVRDRDEAAFAALVKRHATMVYGVCQRLIGDVHMAEDAFQAAFLVLARRAESVRPREQVGNWLYGVAYRTALRARGQLARIRSNEKQVPSMPHPEVSPAAVWHDVQPLLDEELLRLPDKLRLPFVLCDLEGRSQRDVARQCGLPLATLANRLAAARRQLAERLGKRGVALSGGALAVAVTANATKAAAPPLLVAAAARLGAGALACNIPAQVVHLSEGVIKVMFVNKLRLTACCALVSLALAGGGFKMATLTAAESDEKVPTKAPTASNSNPKASKLDDREYLKRVCLNFRGGPPTGIEIQFFVADVDQNKRAKVVEWLIEEKDKKEANERADKQARVMMLLKWRKLMPDATADLDGQTNRLIEAVWTDYSNAFGNKDDRALLLRRIYLDLTGTVPTPEQVKEFTDRKWPDALNKLIERLASDDGPKSSFVRWLAKGDEKADSDDAFLSRVCIDARGTAPTMIEREYFKNDASANKREKLLDLFLKDPALNKKLGADWKRKMLADTDLKRASAEYQRALNEKYRLLVLEANSSWLEKLAREAHTIALPDRLTALLDQLLKEKRSDEQVLEALTTAALGRLPAESEKKLVLASIAQQKDKSAAWCTTLKALLDTAEAKQHAAELSPHSESKEKLDKK